MKILSTWLREYLPGIPVDDLRLAEDLTLRGIAVEGVFDVGLRAGHLFEMDITTNRVDAMNHWGIAREAGAIYHLPLSRLHIDLPAPQATNAAPAAVPFPVRIEEPSLCGRFTARVLRDIRIQPSSGIVAERFRLLDQKLISNAVDATNYVTLAIGHPTHAFDLDKLEGGIVVRRARKGEKLRTLDGIERTLDPDDLVVADEQKALGIAGVIGGWDTMITPETRNVLVEAAWFDPAAVRRSSRRHMVHTDASHRFERGADFNAAPIANALVSRILLEAGGYPEGELVDVVIPAARARTVDRAPVSLALSEVHRHLGRTEDPAGITAAIVEDTLTALGCALTANHAGPQPTPTSPHNPSRGSHGNVPAGAVDAVDHPSSKAWSVALPSWRLDLEREIDLIEEIARVYGYNRFANTLPAFAGWVEPLPTAQKESTVRRTLLALGFHEAVFSTFCSAADAALFAPQPGSGVALGNPLSEEAGMLRPSLVPGMLAMLANNLNRDTSNVALFELGTAFSGTPDRVDERPALAIGATGALPISGPHQPSRPVDFYDLKGAVEELLAKFTARSLYFDSFPAATGLMPAWLHPGRSARVVLDGSTLGYFGQLHPAEAERRKLKQPVYLGELYLDRLYRQPLRQPAPRELSRFQSVRRDFSLLFPDSMRWSEIDDALRQLDIAELASFAPKEVLADPKGKLVPAGQVSILVGTVFQSTRGTLRDEELQSFSERIVSTLESLGGKLRG